LIEIAIVFALVVTTLIAIRISIINTPYPQVMGVTQKSISETETNLGDSPVGIDINTETNIAYVFHDSSIISVINCTTNRVVDTIIAGRHIWDLATNPRTNMLYVTHPTENVISVINGSTNKVVKTVPVGDTPINIAINFDMNQVYIGTLGHIIIMDGNTNRLITNISTRTAFIDMKVNQHTNLIYATDAASKAISIIDGNINRIVANISLDINPYYLAINPFTDVVYVSNQDGNRISVINSTISKIIKTIIVGAYQLADISEIADMLTVNPTTGMLYVTHPTENVISVINGSTNKVVNTITVGNYPTGIVVNQNTDKVYVINKYSNDFNVIDGITDKVLTGSIAVNPPGVKVGDRPVGIAVNPDVNNVYVANSLSNTVSIIDGKTDTTIEDINVNAWPLGVGIDPDMNMIFATNFYSNTVSIIDADTNQSTTSVMVGENPTSIAVNPRLHIVYVFNSRNNSISWFFPGQEQNAIATQSLGPPNENESFTSLENLSPYGIAINSNPELNIIYLADGFSNYIYAMTHAISPLLDIKKISVGGTPTGIAVNPNTNIIYVANRLGYVSKIDTYSNNVLANITVGSSPVGIAVNPNTGTLYVSNKGSNHISVINGTTDVIIANITVGSSPVGIAVNPNTNLIYTAEKSAKSDLVHIIDGSTNEVVTGLSSKVNPSDAAEVYCNGRKIVGYSRVAVGEVECEAKPNPGFAFSYWSGSLNLSAKNNPLTRFNVSESETLTANMERIPPPISQEFLFALYALAATIFTGWFIPTIAKWIHALMQRRRMMQYLMVIEYAEKNNSMYSEYIELDRKIIHAYAKGQINETQYDILIRRISQYKTNSVDSGKP
jgi:YVTN family beta-propeller protein